MIVYRFEDKDGSGPYWAAFARSDKELLQMSNLHDTPSHPSPLEDFSDTIVAMQMQYRMAFGCPSEAALKQWFKGFLRMLYRKGFSIIQYDLPEIIHSKSGRQVAFKHPKFNQS